MLTFAVLSGFVVALAAPWLTSKKPNCSGWLLGILPLGLTGLFLNYLFILPQNQILTESLPWVPSLNIQLSFLLDGLSLLFALLICGVGTLIVIYSGAYLSGHPLLGRFYLYMLIFMASMLGVVLASNIITLFIFWELTSVSSYLLIGFDHHREKAREAALQALLVTGIGGLALLAGMILMGNISGSWELAQLIGQGPQIKAHPHYLAILILVLIGAFTKSAQTPFHFWLPSAMEGPAPVSAFLHSVTMVKAGVYLLFRVSPILGDTYPWMLMVTMAGALTMVVGAYLSLIQKDMKRLLAYTTVNGLGLLVFLTGLGTTASIQAAIIFLMAHAFYKGSLFLTAGVVDHETGSRDVSVLRGLGRKMPLMALAALLAVLSMAGIPPFLGFISKEMVYDALLSLGAFKYLLLGTAIVASGLLVAAGGIFFIRPFLGRPSAPTAKAHAIPLALWLGPLVLALGGGLVGLYPHMLDTSVIAPAVSAVMGRIVSTHTALWHGFNLLLMLSFITLLCGAGLYALFYLLESRLKAWSGIGRWGPDRWYALLLDGLKGFAKWQTQLLQCGYLRRYVTIIAGTAVILVSYTLLSRSRIPLDLKTTDIRLYELVIVGLMLAAAYMTVRASMRLTAIVAIGVIGYSIALIFVDFGAPDLAMTQFVIETMTVILFVLIIYRLPRYKRFSSNRTRFGNAMVAAVSGCLMTVLVLVVLSVQKGSRLSDFFRENSLVLAHGRNIVNVIIVDFRALDTLGEITVLGLAGAGAYTLLKLSSEGN
jgi:multicomponent Na+:H+ antiporter subunit A